jgi:hypothetical protein
MEPMKSAISISTAGSMQGRHWNSYCYCMPVAAGLQGNTAADIQPG